MSQKFVAYLWTTISSRSRAIITLFFLIGILWNILHFWGAAYRIMKPISYHMLTYFGDVPHLIVIWGSGHKIFTFSCFEFCLAFLEDPCVSQVSKYGPANQQGVAYRYDVTSEMPPVVCGQWLLGGTVHMGCKRVGSTAITNKSWLGDGLTDFP